MQKFTRKLSGFQQKRENRNNDVTKIYQNDANDKISIYTYKVSRQLFSVFG